MPSEEEAALDQRIRGLRPTDPPISEKLRTSEHVLARITDGIYRQPSSALRELISNAYDADATEVVVLTDAPRFDVIKIRDNGNGFTPEALGHMIKNIGGSLKRTSSGAGAEVVNDQDPSLSPGGRKLIGKLGIGLFSVSQLTKHFQVITKRDGDPFRTVADVTLKTFSEEELAQLRPGEEPEFETGDVQIHKEPAPDLNAHGTEVILLTVLKRTKAELRSAELWSQVRKSRGESDGAEPVHPPPYHIGAVDEQTGNTIEETANLPWERSEKDPERRFKRIVDAMVGELANVRKPSIRNTFDHYFQMLWTLSLSAPLDYVRQHPFDLTPADGVRVFQLSNESRGQAQEIRLRKGQTVRQALKLTSPDRGKNTTFSIVIDGIQLMRPLQFVDPPKTDSSIQTPLLFVGKHVADFSHFPPENRGGRKLVFEAYLLWMPKIVPIDHIGVLVRMSDASGALFDKTFMNYQVSEQTRREQVSSEIFVHEGLEAALNIDRESFNYSHPHYYVLMRWLHNAFRQLATRHKEVGSQLRLERRQREEAEAVASLEKTVRNALEDAGLEPDRNLAVVEFVAGASAAAEARKKRRKEGVLVFESDRLFGPGREDPLLREKIVRIVQVLEAFHALDNLSADQQELLVQIIAAILKHAK